MSLISLILSYSFINTYAPRIWLDKQELYYPSSIEFIQNNTHLQNISGSNWYVSNENLSDPSGILPYFHGENDLSLVPIYTLITPVINDSDPVISLEQPWNHSVIATYFTFYPYNRGKTFLDTVWDNHVSDIEHVHIYFTNGTPTTIVASWHAWNTTKKWGDSSIEMYKTHPILYSARGSHGLWFSSGEHQYRSFPKLIDYTSKGVEWNTWENNELFFPWNWNSTFWLINVLRWGNPHTDFPVDNCYSVGDASYCRLEDGPVGPLGKSLLLETIHDLENKGLVCSLGCRWSAGIYNFL